MSLLNNLSNSLSFIDDNQYRPGVGLMILNKDNKVFMGQRLDMKDYPEFQESWQMPQGGIDIGESVEAAAYREMLEEIGCDNAQLLAQTSEWLYYDFPSFLQKDAWQGRFLGQKQKWLLFRFLGQDSEININTLQPEFCEWKWMEISCVPEFIVSFKKPLYQQVIKAFKDYFPK